MPKKKSSKYTFDLSRLCTPSSLYFYISAIALFILGIQNILDKDDSFCIGNFKLTSLGLQPVGINQILNLSI